MVRIHTSNLLLARGATLGSRQRTSARSKSLGEMPFDMTPTKTGASEIPYCICMTMDPNGYARGNKHFRRKPYRSKPTQTNSASPVVAAVTMRSSWRGFSDIYSPILARIISSKSLSHSTILRYFIDTRHQLLRLLNYRGASKFWDPVRVSKPAVPSHPHTSTVDLTQALSAGFNRTAFGTSTARSCIWLPKVTLLFSNVNDIAHEVTSCQLGDGLPHGWPIQQAGAIP